MPQVDWLARRVGGVIDFRLPSDGQDIPSEVLRQRTEEYFRQFKAAGRPSAPFHLPPPFPTQDAAARPETAQDSPQPPAQASLL